MSLEELDHTIGRTSPYGALADWTPLHMAAEKGHLRNIKALLEASRFSKKEEKMKYLKMKTDDGSTALDLARKKKKTDVVEVSLRGNKPSNNG